MHGSAKRLPSLAATTVICFMAWKASAQSPGYTTAYTTVDERTFYIQGSGATSLNTSVSFYSLDLTRSWDISNPPWTPVHILRTYPERLDAQGMTMVYSRSLQTLTTLSLARSPAYATRFHLATGEFVDLSGLPPTQASLNAIDGLAGAVDPTTNHVYIPGAYAGGTLMLDYDIVSKTATTQPMPVVANNSSWSGYTFVWNEARESFFLWGGKGPTESSYFFEFKPRSANTWTKLKSKGIVPRPLSDSCMVSAYNGTRMLLFGGHSQDLSFFSATLYILDVETMTWSQELLPVTKEGRAGMACSVSGDNFIIWGGYKNNTAGERQVARTIPLIYNFYSKVWTLSYVPGDHFTPTAKAESAETGSGGSGIGIAAETAAVNSGSGNTVIIASAVGGGVVVVGVVVGLVVCRRNRRRKQQGQASIRGPERDPSQENIDANNHSRFNNKESVLPNSPQEISDRNPPLPPDTSTPGPKHLESFSTSHRIPPAPHTMEYHSSSPNTSMSVSTNYSLYPAPSVYSTSSPSSSRSVPSSSGYHTKPLQLQQHQQGDSSRLENRHMNDTVERGGSQATRMSLHRPQDHSDPTRANEERTLTTTEQLDVLHEQLFAMNSEMSRLQASLES